jgi:hypothetical protein
VVAEPFADLSVVCALAAVDDRPRTTTTLTVPASPASGVTVTFPGVVAPRPNAMIAVGSPDVEDSPVRSIVHVAPRPLTVSPRLEVDCWIWTATTTRSLARNSDAVTGITTGVDALAEIRVIRPNTCLSGCGSAVTWMVLTTPVRVAVALRAAVNVSSPVAVR